VAGVSPSAPYEPIDFLPVTIDGLPMIVGESDSKMGVGPLIYPTQTGTGGQAPYVAHRLPMPHRQTMRCIYLTPEGDLMWYGTGENGAIGPTDAVWISKSPFTTPVLLESLPLNTVALPQEAIPDGDYVWFGNNRIRVEQFHA